MKSLIQIGRGGCGGLCPVGSIPLDNLNHGIGYPFDVSQNVNGGGSFKVSPLDWPLTGDTLAVEFSFQHDGTIPGSLRLSFTQATVLLFHEVRIFRNQFAGDSFTRFQWFASGAYADVNETQPFSINVDDSLLPADQVHRLKYSVSFTRPPDSYDSGNSWHFWNGIPGMNVDYGVEVFAQGAATPTAVTSAGQLRHTTGSAFKCFDAELVHVDDLPASALKAQDLRTFIE